MRHAALNAITCRTGKSLEAKGLENVSRSSGARADKPYLWIYYTCSMYFAMTASHRRKALRMPPGFANQCPLGFTTPFTALVTEQWVIVYALCVETALLGLGLLAVRLRGTASQSAAVSLLLVTGCAIGGLAVAAWTTNSDLPWCMTPPSFAHVTLAQIEQAQRQYGQLLAQTHATLGVIVALFVLATALTVVTLVRGWRANRRRSEAAPA
jgi:hypothetical protein